MSNLIDLGLWPVAVLERAPTGWPSGPAIHYGILTVGELVFHNTPCLGEHLDIADEFLQGLAAWRRDILPEYQAAAHNRLIEALENPQPYRAGYNCQHSVFRVLTGTAQSPTMQGICVGLGIAGAICLAYQNR